MPSLRNRLGAVTAVLALAGGGLLAGCGNDDGATAGSGTDSGGSTSPSPEASATPTPSPSTSATAAPSTAATPSATTSPSPRTTLSATGTAAPVPSGGVLLSAQELPRLAGSTAWTQRSTGPAGDQPFGLCQKFDLLTIGAEKVQQRTYSAGGDTAGEQVATFPDARNTLRAGKVLEAWHRDCAGRVGGESVRVRPIRQVTVPAGSGWTYLVTYERGGQGHVHALGVARSGNRMAVLRMDHEGQDHDYPAGQEPMELAVKAAAAKLR